MDRRRTHAVVVFRWIVAAVALLALALPPRAVAAEPPQVFTVAGSESTGAEVPELCDGNWFCDEASPWPASWMATGYRFAGTCLDHFPDGSLLLCSGEQLVRVGLDGRARVVPLHGVKIGSSEFGLPDELEVDEASVAPDGSIWLAGDWGAAHVAPDGTATSVVSVSQAPYATGVEALADGSALVAENIRNRIVRLWPDGRRQVVAGATHGVAITTGGVPANRAALKTPSDISAFPDGSYVISDDAGHVFRVDAAGQIRLIAGGGKGWTEGAPATSVTLSWSPSVEALPDGRVFVAANAGLLEIDAAGRIHTVAAGARELAGRGFADVREIDTDGRALSGVQFPSVDNLDVLPGGQVLALAYVPASGWRVVELAAAPELDRFAISLSHEDRRLLPSGRLDVVTTRPATLRVLIHRPGGAFTTDVSVHAEAGTTSVAVPALTTAGVEEVRIDATSDDGAVATTRMVIAGPRLEATTVRALAARVDWSGGMSMMETAHCRRRTATYYVCRWQIWGDFMAARGWSSFRLRADGLIAYKRREFHHKRGTEHVDDQYLLEPSG